MVHRKDLLRLGGKEGKWDSSVDNGFTSLQAGGLERLGPGERAKVMFKPTSEGWAAIKEDVCKRSVIRSTQQCKDRWK